MFLLKSVVEIIITKGINQMTDSNVEQTSLNNQVEQPQAVVEDRDVNFKEFVSLYEEGYRTFNRVNLDTTDITPELTDRVVWGELVFDEFYLVELTGKHMQILIDSGLRDYSSIYSGNDVYVPDLTGVNLSGVSGIGVKGGLAYYKMSRQNLEDLYEAGQRDFNGFEFSVCDIDCKGLNLSGADIGSAYITTSQMLDLLRSSESLQNLNEVEFWITHHEPEDTTVFMQTTARVRAAFQIYSTVSNEMSIPCWDGNQPEEYTNEVVEAALFLHHIHCSQDAMIQGFRGYLQSNREWIEVGDSSELALEEEQKLRADFTAHFEGFKADFGWQRPVPLAREEDPREDRSPGHTKRMRV